MNKIIIIGSKGMAGHVIRNFFLEDSLFEVIDVARNDEYFKPTYQLDITDFNALKEILLKEMPCFVINCVGILNADAENYPDKAILLNSYLPHFLARICTSISAKLIHISTDCVFSGKKGNYTEIDLKDGTGFYSESKSLGEVNYGEHLTIRTSIIGPELKPSGIGLLQWFLLQKDTIHGYNQAFWSGVTTLELAKAIKTILLSDHIVGLYHLTNNQKISKYELLKMINKITKSDINIISVANKNVDKSIIDTRSELSFVVNGYEEMLEEMFKYINKNRILYPIYNF
jgi:dTDP-4-dehydrorhamnose reductase